MNLKSKKCASCGARLTYNSSKHRYECEYCGASYVDEKNNGEPDPRVELTPDDLKKVTSNMKSAMNNSNVFIKIVGIIVFSIFAITIFSFVINFFTIFMMF